MRSDNKRSCMIKGSIPWNWMRGILALVMALGIFLAMPSMEVEAEAYVTIDKVTYELHDFVV